MSSKHLARHYIEMVVAMFVGLAVLGVPAARAMGAMGIDWNALTDDAPALMFLGMATTMTVPMVGWMLYRGHSWRANAEMSTAMFVPTFAVIGLLWAGVLTDVGVVGNALRLRRFEAQRGQPKRRPPANRAE